jgi:hypothetical protein
MRVPELGLTRPKIQTNRGRWSRRRKSAKSILVARDQAVPRCIGGMSGFGDARAHSAAMTFGSKHRRRALEQPGPLAARERTQISKVGLAITAGVAVLAAPLKTGRRSA